ncbi:hypothetical protein DMA11_22615 [Marinilabiliaceae bacterium JC017]|nr:hypothetical protein DMA11_22615 [Marinilabiliaceae bacterium JC017]
MNELGELMFGQGVVTTKRDASLNGGTTITVDRLKKRGYIPLADMYNQMSSSLPTNLNSILTASIFNFP